jgi:hypothetical protein
LKIPVIDHNYKWVFEPVKSKIGSGLVRGNLYFQKKFFIKRYRAESGGYMGYDPGPMEQYQTLSFNFITAKSDRELIELIEKQMEQDVIDHLDGEVYPEVARLIQAEISDHLKKYHGVRPNQAGMISNYHIDLEEGPDKIPEGHSLWGNWD